MVKSVTTYLGAENILSSLQWLAFVQALVLV
jgi:hypothetical protein